jgi:hypothetical protein
MKAIILSVALFLAAFSNAFAAQKLLFLTLNPQSASEATEAVNEWIKKNPSKKVVSFQFRVYSNAFPREEVRGVWILYEEKPFEPVESGRRQG